MPHYSEYKDKLPKRDLLKSVKFINGINPE